MPTIRLSEMAKATTRPRDAWLVVGFVVLLLGSMGYQFLQTGKVPTPGPLFFGGSLALIWGAALYHLFRYGRRAMPWQRLAYLIAYTLFAGGHLWPHPPAAVTIVSNICFWTVAFANILPFFGLGNSRQKVNV